MRKYASLLGTFFIVAVMVAFGVFFVIVFQGVHLTPPADPYIPAPLIPKDKQIVIGVIGDSSGGERFKPLAKYLKDALSPLGVKYGEVIVADTPSEMANLLKLRHVDLYIDSFFPALTVASLGDAEIMASLGKEGENMESAIIFTASQSGVKNLSGLLGKRIAFQEEYSSLSLFSMATLLAKGFTLEALLDSSSYPIGQNIGYYFVSRGEERIINDVKENRAAAGALSESSFRALSERESKDFLALYKSPPMVKQAVVISKKLPEKISSVLPNLLFEMNQNEKGKSILSSLGESFAFYPVSSGSLASFDTLAGLVEEDIMKQR